MLCLGLFWLAAVSWCWRSWKFTEAWLEVTLLGMLCPSVTQKTTFLSPLLECQTVTVMYQLAERLILVCFFYDSKTFKLQKVKYWAIYLSWYMALQTAYTEPKPQIHDRNRTVDFYFNCFTPIWNASISFFVMLDVLMYFALLFRTRSCASGVARLIRTRNAPPPSEKLAERRPP